MRFNPLHIALVSAIVTAAGLGQARSQQTSHNFTVSVGGGSFPIIDATTDMPDGTSLFFNITKPWLPDGPQRVARGVPACEGACFAASTDGGLTGATGTVQN